MYIMKNNVLQIKRSVVQRLNNIHNKSNVYTDIQNFDRIAYSLQLDNSNIYIEFDKYTDNIIYYLLNHKQNNKQILTNVILKVNGKNINTTNVTLLFSPYNYLPDSKDNEISDGNYGRFQIYNDNNIICAYNNFQGIGDIVIGVNTKGKFKDWSFSNNLDKYKTKRFTVYAIETIINQS